MRDRKHASLFWITFRPILIASVGEIDPLVLEFHHLHRKEKEISVMITGGYPIATIRAEILKCGVLCTNWHRRKTAKERGWFRNGV